MKSYCVSILIWIKNFEVWNLFILFHKRILLMYRSLTKLWAYTVWLLVNVLKLRGDLIVVIMEFVFYKTWLRVKCDTCVVVETPENKFHTVQYRVKTFQYSLVEKLCVFILFHYFYTSEFNKFSVKCYNARSERVNIKRLWKKFCCERGFIVDR